MKNKKSNENAYSKLSVVGINIAYILALCVVLLPLLLVAGYNYPSADDWSFGHNTYWAISAGGGPVEFIKALFQTVSEYYMGWEGRFSIAFLGALQPGIWGEEFYCIVPWIMLGGLVLGEMTLVAGFLRAENKAAKWLWIPIIVPSLIMQILYTPNTVESFYWYNGSVNYTFIFSLSMVLFTLFLKLASEDMKGWRRGICTVLTSLMAILIGGNNFSTSLSSLLSMVILCVLFFVFKRNSFYRTWYLPLLTGVSIIVSILAPGNSVRLNSNFEGETTGMAFKAIGMSLVRSFTNIYSWTNIKIILMLLLIVPFAWMAVKYIKYDFRFPALFTILTFGVYASQITATLYVDGTTGGGRMAAILYYSYHIWMVGNICYWVGWIRRKYVNWQVPVKNIVERTGAFVRRFILLYCALIGVLLVGIIYSNDMKEISSYKAYRDWRQGWAQQYAKEWDARLEVLKDPSVTEVVFEPLSVYPESYMYTDLQDEKGYTWVNTDCATYYSKESIIVVNPTNTKTE